ncbi:toll/interleukin-1 receptor domain-containing protein [Nitrosospira multiformis]|uniref:TIR domain-containing protein n=1 Tax=Nitrosospira multiformis TaxID=1231 RepID=A0A1I7FT06_9PROT|nr:toll/interleukin-1 receptor domain-containing protein [Nitrosospira multiformis]SFU39315.1 TIR domain-containing protein [Nitrosospira multiformis]
MFYVFNVQQWLDEVVSACSENNLDPEESVFILLMFSSLDFDFVTFFRDRKPQISQYSGENVHIFTPMIFDEDIVPDGEWRLIRDNFNDAGILLSNRPSAILFHLQKRSHATGYDPHYFAAFELPTFERFERSLRDFVDACIAHRRNAGRLTRELGTLFKAQNRVRNVLPKTPLSESFITDVLHAPKVFISYSHADKQSVLDLYQQLKDAGVKLWLDQFELLPGALFQQEIERALHASDAVLVVLSRNSNESKWVSFEGSLFYGQGNKKPIIPIVLDEEGKILANELPFLNGRLYVDLSNAGATQEGVARISSALSELQHSRVAPLG